MKLFSYFKPNGDGVGRRGTTKVQQLEKELQDAGYEPKTDVDGYTYYEVKGCRVYVSHRFGAAGLPYAWITEN